MHNQICEALLKIEIGERSYEQVTNYFADEGESIFRTYCERILKAYCDNTKSISWCWIAVSGRQPEKLTPIAASPPAAIDAAQTLSRKDSRDPANVRTSLLKNAQDFNSIPTTDIQVFPLQSATEFFGIIVFCSSTRGGFDAAEKSAFQETQSLLNRLLAEAIFTQRLTVISAPLRIPAAGENPKSFYEAVVERACRGLAADGAVLRVAEVDGELINLEPKASHGILASIHLVSGSVFEKICLRLFHSQNHLTMQMLEGPEAIGYGESITIEDRRELLRHGIQSYMIVKLFSHPSGNRTQFGTLSVFHRVPQLFSARDISLFQGFCERVSNELTIIDERSSDITTSRLLSAQNAMGQRAEIISLLGHDFGHKVFHSDTAVKDLTRGINRAWPDVKPPHIKTPLDALTKATNELNEAVFTLRQLSLGATEDDQNFEVKDIFEEINKTFRPVFERYNMDLEVRLEGNTTGRGQRRSLLQALFNLVLNSIDAQKARVGNNPPKKTNHIHLHCQGITTPKSHELRFTIWDNGGGISWAHFPNAQDIFLPGKTSKPANLGGGLGLTAARNLLSNAFQADLQLRDRAKALFQFTIRVD